MLVLFDYVFYRAYKLGVGRSKAPISYAAGVVVGAQFFVLLTLLAIANYFFALPELNTLSFVIIALVLIGLNWYRYERNSRLDEMNKIWGGEEENAKLIKGWLIVLCIALFAITPFYIAKKDYDSKHPYAPRVHRIK